MPTESIRSSIRQCVAAIRSSDLPLQVQAIDLLQLGAETVGMDEVLFVRENADFISDIMDNRNVEGAAFESLQQQSKAVELYEANLKDRFKGILPYERLRALYASTGRYADAIRVCEAYVAYGEDDEPGKARYREWIANH
jgi:hypothetical protein